MQKDVFERKIRDEEITTEDLLSSEFIKKYTSFHSYEEMEEEISRRAGKGKKPDMNKLIQNIFREKTIFKNMEDMKKKAIEFYMLMN